MKCPKCGGKLKETEGVLYGGKHAYYCILCGYKNWLYKQDQL